MKLMIASNVDHIVPGPARAAHLDALAPAHPRNRSAESARLRRRLHRAEALLEHDPDAAALLLDGLASALASLASREGRASPDPHGLLAAVQASDPLLALRLRVALRAPDVRARIVHARACLDRLEFVCDTGASREATSC